MNRARRDVEQEFGPIDRGLVHRLRAGMSIREIAKEWKVSPTTVMNWMDAAGIERRVMVVWAGE